MTEYLRPKFSVAVGGEKYREGWDAVFGRKTVDPLRDVFDRVKTHLLSQGKRALDEAQNCYYRSPDGLKCAVGCLITDENYDRNLEGYSIGADLGALKEALTKSGVNVEHPGMMLMLERLQSIHDSEPVSSRWPEALDLLERELFG